MKQSRASRAEKALQQAIAEETTALQTEIRRLNARVTHLETVLGSIARTAMSNSAPVDGERVVVPVLPQIEEPPQSTGPSVPLAAEDTMGEGRFV